MEKDFEQFPGPVYPQEVENITLRAVEMDDFKNAVRDAKDKFTAIVAVRILLKERFPEITTLPEPQHSDPDPYALVYGKPKHLTPPVNNEFRIAKDIVDLLWEK